MTHGTARIVVGVDTHADVHVAAALDLLGRVVGRLEVPTTARGYVRLLGWSRELDANVIFGVEGTGAYGAGLARYLTAAGCDVALLRSRLDRLLCHPPRQPPRGPAAPHRRLAPRASRGR